MAAVVQGRDGDGHEEMGLRIMAKSRTETVNRTGKAPTRNTNTTVGRSYGKTITLG